MSISLFFLAMYVFLQSEVVLGKWFTVDPRFTAFVGFCFVIVVVLETLFTLRSNDWHWKKVA